MADPIPVNSRRERNPQPTPTPFGNRPPLGGLPPRPNLQANPPAQNPFQRGGNARNNAAQPPARQAPQGTLFERRNPRQRRRREGVGESFMYVIAGIVLIVIVILSRAAQSPPSEITSYEPRSGGVVVQSVDAVQPTAQATNAPITTPTFAATRVDWGPAGASSGVTAWVTQRDLIRACPNEACVALSNPTILEVGLLTDIVAVDPTQNWAMINANRPDGSLASGWIHLSAVRLNGDLNIIPVTAG